MRDSRVRRPLATALLILSAAVQPLCAKEPAPMPQASAASASADANARAPAPAAPAATPAPASNELIVPMGTRLPLILRNGVNTRTAKPGDSVYFESAYPITANNRMAIPMGTFVRGEIVSAKRPGFLKGRGEFRVAIRQMTFVNGYTIELLASPGSVDPKSGAGVDAEGKIKGPSSAIRDTTAVLLTTAGGAYIGAIAGPGVDPQPRYAAAQQDARARQREERRRHPGSSMLLPLLLFPLLR
ncbi:MAG TPA: hypothetical protein VEI73_14360 [Candidatus Acidoferrum sp.]|nr:hypothetical protein [Candidatus Acidoferrum sp.]